MTVIGEIDPLAYELLIQQRPRVARLFEVIRLAPMTEEDALEVAPRLVERPRHRRRRRHPCGGARPRASHYLPGDRVAREPAPAARARTRTASQRGLADAVTPRDGDRDAQRRDRAVAGPARPAHAPGPRGDPVRSSRNACSVSRTRSTASSSASRWIKAGLTDPTRPLGVFLFVGPTGTGKTELAKATAELLFGAGGPARAPRHERVPDLRAHWIACWPTRRVESSGAQLIAAVRSQPFSVVLLDEFEKAHQYRLGGRLAVFDDRRLTDRGGRTTDFRHCVIILTSNIGSAACPAAPGSASAARRPASSSAGGVERGGGRSAFRPELLNRFDRTVVFRPLGRDVMRCAARARAAGCVEPARVPGAAVGGRVGRGGAGLPARARVHRRAGRAPDEARDRAAPARRRWRSRSSSARFPEGDQFLFITARDGAGLDVAVRRPRRRRGASRAPADRGRPDPRERCPGAAGLRGRGCLPPRGARRARRGRAPRGRRRRRRRSRATRDHTFWQSEDRFAVLGLIEYLDRLGAATATARTPGSAPLAGREAHSRELVQLLARRLHVLAAALAGLEAGRRERRHDHAPRRATPTTPRRASSSCRSWRRCTSAGRTPAACASAGAARTRSCSRSTGSAPTRS